MSISLSCRLALVAANADHEIVVVNTMAGESTREPFLTINPLGQVPVLECDGMVLTQAVAILRFIADRTGKGWTHASDLDQAKALSIMVLTTAEIQSFWTMNNRPERFVDTESSRPEVVARALARLEKAYNEVERQLGTLPEDRELGVLDYYVGVFALWKVMVPAASGFARTPRLDAVRERVLSVPRLKQIIDEDIATHTARVS
jgi:glutathione S-transferase